MNRRIGFALLVLGIALWGNARTVLALCTEDSVCAPNKVCIDAHCVYPPNCIAPGGIDDTLYATSCCSGMAVAGSTFCLNPGDYGTTWASCYQTCA